MGPLPIHGNGFVRLPLETVRSISVVRLSPRRSPAGSAAFAFPIGGCHHDSALSRGCQKKGGLLHPPRRPRPPASVVSGPGVRCVPLAAALPFGVCVESSAADRRFGRINGATRFPKRMIIIACLLERVKRPKKKKNAGGRRPFSAFLPERFRRRPPSGLRDSLSEVGCPPRLKEA